MKIRWEFKRTRLVSRICSRDSPFVKIQIIFWLRTVLNCFPRSKKYEIVASAHQHCNALLMRGCFRDKDGVVRYSITIEVTA